MDLENRYTPNIQVIGFIISAVAFMLMSETEEDRVRVSYEARTLSSASVSSPALCEL